MIFRKKISNSTILDLMLIQSASRYVVNDKIQREKSVKDLERLFFKSLEAIKPELFLEIGAWEATASLKVRKILPETKVSAYEANPYSYKEHRKRLKKNGVEYVNVALTKKKGPVSMHIRLDDNGKHDKNAGNTSLMGTSTEHAGEYENVKVNSMSVDAAARKTRPSSIAMWIDVEGALKEVLPSAKKALRKTDIVFVEVEDREYWKGQWLKKDVDSFMLKHGLLPVARDFQSRYQYNVIYVSENLLHTTDLVRRRLTEFNTKQL